MSDRKDRDGRAGGSDGIGCNQVATLVPGYLDGELSEEQATPLRRHLLSCPTCRCRATDLTNLRRWFSIAAPTGAVQIPHGFAARVARAAFSPAGQGSGETAEISAVAANATAGKLENSVLPFVLAATSLAAGLLLTLSFLIGMRSQPAGVDLSAEPLPDILRELDELNAQDGEVRREVRDRR